MLKHMLLLICGSVLALGSLTALARESVYNGASDQGRHEQDHRDDADRILKVGLWGDQFHADDPTLRARMARQRIDSKNARELLNKAMYDSDGTLTRNYPR